MTLAHPRRPALVLAFRLACLGAGAIALTRDAEATNYQLTCNALDDLDLDSGSPGVYYFMGFGAAPQAAGVAPPPARTCAWHDRPMRSTEPNCLSIQHGQAPQMILSSQGAPPDLTCGNLASTSVECGFVQVQTRQVTFTIASGTDFNGCFQVVSKSP